MIQQPRANQYLKISTSIPFVIAQSAGHEQRKLSCGNPAGSNHVIFIILAWACFKYGNRLEGLIKRCAVLLSPGRERAYNPRQPCKEHLKSGPRDVLLEIPA